MANFFEDKEQMKCKCGSLFFKEVPVYSLKNIHGEIIKKPEYIEYVCTECGRAIKKR